MLIGLTLPSFRDRPDRLLEVAGAADRAGVDGVFAFDHLFRGDAGRPAQEVLTVLGALAAETSRVRLGTLVARANLRPPATLAAGLDTVARIAGPRLIAAIGSGDRESEEEDRTFGVDVAPGERLLLAEATVRAVVGRGYPVWVGGRSPALRRLAALHADGWNLWGAGPAAFATQAAEVRRLRGSRGGAFASTWGGLVLMGSTEEEAQRKARRLDPRPGVLCGGPERLAEALLGYREAGADWVVLAPLDSADPDNARVVGETLRPLLS